MTRQPDVAVVKSDDVEAARDESVTEPVGPAQHLGSQPHQQQHRRQGRISEASVGDVQTIRSDAACDLDAHSLFPRIQYRCRFSNRYEPSACRYGLASRVVEAEATPARDSETSSVASSA